MKTNLNINLLKATPEDANELFQMQIMTFKPLLEKYQDFDRNQEMKK